jgi:hypothetical protein
MYLIDIKKKWRKSFWPLGDYIEFKNKCWVGRVGNEYFFDTTDFKWL